MFIQLSDCFVLHLVGQLLILNYTLRSNRQNGPGAEIPTARSPKQSACAAMCEWWFDATPGATGYNQPYPKPRYVGRPSAVFLPATYSSFTHLHTIRFRITNNRNVNKCDFLHHC